MASITVRVAGSFGRVVSEPKTYATCLLPRGMEERLFAAYPAGQVYNKPTSAVSLDRGGIR